MVCRLIIRLSGLSASGAAIWRRDMQTEGLVAVPQFFWNIPLREGIEFRAAVLHKPPCFVAAVCS